MLAEISSSVLAAPTQAAGTASQLWIWGLCVLLIAGVLEVVFCTVGAVLKAKRCKARPSD